ncbi:MAG TPA: endonuclease/exonuclease/phosphatase family protein [Streptosporangiaceae bacterium]|jgi:endonuclease/exonuclease/phosphatase family metal-dependent hydrolase
MSYNVRALRDDVAALARVVRAQAPDVLCVQEAPRFARWRTRRADLARRFGMYVAAGERTGGLAIFASLRAAVVRAEYHVLSHVPRLHRRALAVAVLDIAGAGPVIAASTHLDLDPAARLRHAAEIEAILADVHRRHDAPLVLAGDLNEGPDGPAWRRLATGRTGAPPGAAPTFPAYDPHRRIDAIFVTPPLRARTTGVSAPPEPDVVRASDHRPVTADLDYGPAPTPE